MPATWSFVSQEQLLVHRLRDIGQDTRPIHLSSMPADPRWGHPKKRRRGDLARLRRQKQLPVFLPFQFLTIRGVTEVITAPRSPWQNPYVERLIGSIRRECLDHVIILNERHLRRVLSSNIIMTPERISRSTCPRPRRLQLPSAGDIIAFPEVGGLHHRYERRAASLRASSRARLAAGTLRLSLPNCLQSIFEQGQQQISRGSART
jgi:hypothetical protein